MTSTIIFDLWNEDNLTKSITDWRKMLQVSHAKAKEIRQTIRDKKNHGNFVPLNSSHYLTQAEMFQLQTEFEESILESLRIRIAVLEKWQNQSIAYRGLLIKKMEFHQWKIEKEFTHKQAIKKRNKIYLSNKRKKKRSETLQISGQKRHVEEIYEDIPIGSEREEHVSTKRRRIEHSHSKSKPKTRKEPQETEASILLRNKSEEQEVSSQTSICKNI